MKRNPFTQTNPAQIKKLRINKYIFAAISIDGWSDNDYHIPNLFLLIYPNGNMPKLKLYEFYCSKTWVKKY